MENNGDAKTCGELYLETVREFCKTDGDRVAFAVGMAYGQAEKVCNGCCMAAMFRPRSENFAQFLPMVQSIAEPRPDGNLTTTG